MLQQVALFVLALVVLQVPAKEFIPVDFVENIDSNDVPSGSGSRIVSGWDAQPGQHPHQANLRMINAVGRITGCGGSIIHKEWVLTAAHCSAGQLTIEVRVGGVQLSKPDVSTEASEFYLYPTYDGSRPSSVQLNDVSLLKLLQPLQYTQNIRAIRVQPSWDAHRDYSNEVVYASGYGRVWTEGNRPEILQWVYLRGVSNSECVSTYGTNFVNQNTICARFFNVTSQSVCHGDSGGPLVHMSVEGEPILIGISSFVPGNPHGCHSGFPGAFIRPAPFHYWFEEITGIDFNNLNEDEEVTTTVTPTTLSSTTWASTTPEPTTEPTTLPTTVTVPPTTSTTPDSEKEEEDDDDKEISELLKKLEVKVKVKVKLTKNGQTKKIKKEKRIDIQ